MPTLTTIRYEFVDGTEEILTRTTEQHKVYQELNAAQIHCTCKLN